MLNHRAAQRPARTHPLGPPLWDPAAEAVPELVFDQPLDW